MTRFVPEKADKEWRRACRGHKLTLAGSIIRRSMVTGFRVAWSERMARPELPAGRVIALPAIVVSAADGRWYGAAIVDIAAEAEVAGRRIALF